VGGRDDDGSEDEHDDERDAVRSVAVHDSNSVRYDIGMAEAA
jgi:hypothetical protein